MSGTLAILSLLHEGAASNSGTRTFRARPVLAWTLDRLARSRKVNGTLIVCWDDQRPSTESAAPDTPIFSQPRTGIPQLDQITTAQRWSDGWRGGLLSTCHHDQGFHAATIQKALQASTDDLILINPSSSLVDPTLIDALIEHAQDHPKIEYAFTQSAPGLAGLFLRRTLLDRLAAANTYPGRLLAYHPDTPGRDPMTTDMCLAVPPAIARTTHRFTLDSARQIHRVTNATASLNGQLISTGAESLVQCLNVAPADTAPREITLELTTRRSTQPIYAPTTHLNIGRGDMPLGTFKAILSQLKDIDDLRLTLAGAGDPLLHPQLPEILSLLGQTEIAVHLETDLLHLPDPRLLTESRLDILTLHLPAATAATYQRIMGVDGLQKVLENLKQLLTHRRATPLIVPTFTKCRQNLDEMEIWYDHWLKILSQAVITAPSTHAGQIPDHACADMSPPTRRPCTRINSRMTILSDGTIPTCEQDVQAQQPQGHSLTDQILPTWQQEFPILRQNHGTQPLCATCTEWHRP